MPELSFTTDCSLTTQAKPISMIFIDMGCKQQDQKDGSSLFSLPVWRWLWLKITSSGGRIDFMQTCLDGNVELAVQLKDKNYDIILIHLDNYIPTWFYSFVSSIQEADINIVLCGFLPTIKSKEIMEALPAVKMVLKGPLERSLMSLFGVYEKGYSQNDMDKLSEVQLEDFKNLFLRDSVGVIQASAGCPMSCSFCRCSSFYHQYYNGSYTQYPIDNIVCEISELHHKYHISHFMFHDSNFLGYGKMVYKRACELAESLQKYGLGITFDIHCRSDALQPEVISMLKSCGLLYVAFGIESMSPSQLERFEKRETVIDHERAVELLSKYGIPAQGYSILADPLVTREELLENLTGLYELNKKILVLINEKMILYDTTKYYKKYCKLLHGLVPNKNTLDTIYYYEFNDPWCKDNFEIIQEASSWLKYKIMTYARTYKSNISTGALYLFAKKSTSYHIELLKRIVLEDSPDKNQVMFWCEEAMEKIKSIL